MRSNDCVWKIIPQCLWMFSFRPMFFNQKIAPQNIELWRSCRCTVFGSSVIYLVDTPQCRYISHVGEYSNILQTEMLEITWVELSAHVKNFQLLTHCFSVTCAHNHSHPQIHIIHAIHIITNHRTQPINNQKHNSPIINQNTRIINKQSPWKSSIIISINHHFETAELSASSASFAATLAFPISSSFSSSDPTEVFCVAAVVGGPLLPKKLNKWRTEKWWFVKVRESFI